MDKVWRLLGEGRVRRRFTAAADVRKGLQAQVLVSDHAPNIDKFSY